MKLFIDNKRAEIQHAIRQSQSNIQWLKRRVIFASKNVMDDKAVRFYTQKIEAQEMLLKSLSKYDSTHNHLH
ncbi:MAG: hypothetical protein V4660_20685 [Pseudomonadota bacterium]